jgi:hypothetical protein
VLVDLKHSELLLGIEQGRGLLMAAAVPQVLMFSLKCKIFVAKINARNRIEALLHCSPRVLYKRNV